MNRQDCCQIVRGEKIKMWDGKKRAVTFSYDDGVEQDRHLVDLFNAYGMKATFNLNSGIQTRAFSFVEGKSGIVVRRMNQQGLRELYRGHEIASHGLTHANPLECDEETLFNEVLADKRNLEQLFEQEVVGYAYPYGCYHDLAVKVLSDCGIRYARTVESVAEFGLQKDLLRFKPCYHHNDDRIFEGIEQFLSLETKEPALLYIWGHSYEFEADQNWDRMEKILKQLAGRSDIFYGSDAQVLLHENAE